MPLVTPFLSVVIPAYNEEQRIGRTIEALVEFLNKQSYTWEIVVVENASTDLTAKEVTKWADQVDGIKLLYQRLAGKGRAVKRGMLAATGELRFMYDADMSMRPDFIPTFLSSLNHGYDVVIGSRQIKHARRIGEPPGRHVMGRVFNRVVSVAAVKGFYDTQCGFKCFRGEVADELFQMQHTEGFAFDVELLFLANKRGFSVIEIPIDWYYNELSKVRLIRHSFEMLRDTLLVRWRDLRGMYG